MVKIGFKKINETVAHRNPFKRRNKKNKNEKFICATCEKSILLREIYTQLNATMATLYVNYMLKHKIFVNISLFSI